MDRYAPTIPAPHPCEHGWGDRCECQLPHYPGLYVIPIVFKHDGLTRHIVARMKQVHDGGMLEFHDPVTGDVVGSSGINFLVRIEPLDVFESKVA